MSRKGCVVIRELPVRPTIRRDREQGVNGTCQWRASSSPIPARELRPRARGQSRRTVPCRESCGQWGWKHGFLGPHLPGPARASGVRFGIPTPSRTDGDHVPRGTRPAQLGSSIPKDGRLPRLHPLPIAVSRILKVRFPSHPSVLPETEGRGLVRFAFPSQPRYRSVSGGPNGVRTTMHAAPLPVPWG